VVLVLLLLLLLLLLRLLAVSPRGIHPATCNLESFLLRKRSPFVDWVPDRQLVQAAEQLSC
jgi:hypothetical protein